jgi:hemerythrin superfamily protein
MYVTDLIALDHRTVREMFARLEAMPAADTGGRQQMLDQLVAELDVHARAEEAVFYPAVRAVSRRIDDAEAGHMHMRDLIAEAQALDASADDFMDAVRRLKGAVLSHAGEEEGGIFLDAARLGLDELARLGEAMQREKDTLKQQPRKAA